MDYKKFSASRLAAVQTIYMMEYGRPVDDIIDLFTNGDIGGEALIDDKDSEFEKKVTLVEMDKKLFGRIARGTAFRFEELLRLYSAPKI